MARRFASGGAARTPGQPPALGPKQLTRWRQARSRQRPGGSNVRRGMSRAQRQETWGRAGAPPLPPPTRAPFISPQALPGPGSLRS